MSGMKNYLEKERSFTDYIRHTRQLIKSARTDLADLTPEQIRQRIDANAPAEHRPATPTRHGILLIHGLNSSPGAMSSLMNHFGSHYLVRSVLLPGHGTHPKDLLEVTYQDWLDVCRFGIKTLKEEVDHVTVIAFSAGTALAVYLSQTEDSIDSLVLLAPALSLKNPLSPFVPLLYPLRHYFSKINWPILKTEKDYAKYQSMPINAIYQITKVMKAIQRSSKPLTIPLYIASTTDDETISHDKALHFFLKQPHSLNRGIIYTCDQFSCKNQPLPVNLVHRKSCYPEEKILDFSHVSLTIAPDHPHYGKQGDFSDFSHYERNRNHKHKNKPIHHGSISGKNLKKHHIQRLSYNPDFDYLATDIEAFLKECFVKG